MFDVLPLFNAVKLHLLVHGVTFLDIIQNFAMVLSDMVHSC